MITYLNFIHLSFLEELSSFYHFMMCDANLQLMQLNNFLYSHRCVIAIMCDSCELFLIGKDNKASCQGDCTPNELFHTASRTLLLNRLYCIRIKCCVQLIIYQYHYKHTIILQEPIS